MKRTLLLLSLLLSFFAFTQQEQRYGVWFNEYSSKSPEVVTNFAVKGDLDRLKQNQRVFYKYSAGGWHHIRCTSDEIKTLIHEGLVSQIFFAPSKPALLGDTLRAVQNIDSVHQGEFPLIDSLTGRDIIIGYIDSGLDYNHEDFKNEDGSTRVLYYWDHSLPVDPLLTPTKYGYGQLWDSTHINAGTCLSIDNNAHGTTVTGAGSGNGRAADKHAGAAPNTDIIIVETNFSLANWTLSIADGIDFIFSMADTLGKPAVVNTSLGDYLGSHDGLDPASQVIDSLLMDKPGRIVVAAAGNSGAQGEYHIKANSTATDTTFTWYEVNMSSGFGYPAVFFDLWADSANFNNVEFAFGADNQAPFDFRGRTDFYSIVPYLGTTQEDSIMVAGNKLAHIEFYMEEVNGLYHIETIITPDSTDYLYRFETKGEGVYDAWSGAWIGLSYIKNDGMPTVAEMPEIVNYQYPDTLVTTVSSWTCSPNVVTVGNFRARHGYDAYDGSYVVLGGDSPGKLSPNSSKGPNRVGHTKPDVAATGDGLLTACPLWLQTSLMSSNPTMLDVEGQHVRNGGTSMASPVIAGIAALYLEKCSSATYADFINDLHTYAYEDGFTDVTPNLAYGYGKVNAFQLLITTNFEAHVTGNTLICEFPQMVMTVEDDFYSYDWSNDSTNSTVLVNETDTIWAVVTDSKGCKAITDSLNMFKGEVPEFPVLNILGGGIVTVPADGYIWYFEGDTIDGETEQFLDPDTTGHFYVEVYSDDGCSLFSDSIYIDLTNIIEMGKNDFIVFPNPFTTNLNLLKNDFYDVNLVFTDIQGKVIFSYDDVNSNDLFLSFDLSDLANGTYLLNIFYENNFKSVKLIKQ